MNNPQKNPSRLHLIKPKSLSSSNKLHLKPSKFNSWKTTFATWHNKRKSPHLDRTAVLWNKTAGRLQSSWGKKDKLTKSTEIWGQHLSQSISSKRKSKGWKTMSKKTRNSSKWYHICKPIVVRKTKSSFIASIKWGAKFLRNNWSTPKTFLEALLGNSALTSDPYLRSFFTL